MDFDSDFLSQVSLLITAVIGTVIFIALLSQYGSLREEDPVRYSVKAPEAVQFPYEGAVTDKLTSDVRLWMSW